MREGARAIILKNKKILLGRRLKKDSFYGSWCTFGGYIEPGETPTQALKRELDEELGMEIVKPEPFAVTETSIEGDSREALRLHFFLVKDWKGKITNKSEHSEIRWFSKDELGDLPMGWIGKKVIVESIAELFMC